MTSREIRSQMVLSGVTVAGLGRDLGVSRNLVSEVVHQRRTNPRVRRAVAHAIHRSYLEVWGEPDPDQPAEVAHANSTTPPEESHGN